MHYQIREACAEDAKKIARLIDVLGYQLDSALLVGRMEAYANQFSRVFVAIDESALVGFIAVHTIPLFHEVGMLGRIAAMAIDPEHQRKGIGTLLVKAAEDFAISLGSIRMEVTSGDKREQDAHIFYGKQGYASDCRRFLKPLIHQST